MTALTLALAMVIIGAPPEGPDPPDSWRDSLRCGPNCLYAFLSLHGRPRTLDDILERVPIGPRGAALDDLRRAAAALGVPSRVVRSSPDRLGDWPLPAVAHLDVREGHYVLVVAVTAEDVTVADMSTGEIKPVASDQFFATWSGYLLVADTERAARLGLWGAGFAACAGLAAFLRKRAAAGGEPGAGKPAGRGPIVAGVVSILAVILGWASSGPSASGRDPGQAGATVILERPVAIPPTWTRDGVAASIISPGRWDRIAVKLQPDRPLPQVAHLLHHLETWGSSAAFPGNPAALSGPRMLVGLLQGRTDSPLLPQSPLIYRDSSGRPRLTSSGEEGSETHTNQVLASCAALGLPSRQTLESDGIRTTLAALVERAREDFHLRGETEWSAMALARYAPSREPWRNRWGHSSDFDAIAEHFLSTPFGQGTCAGTHVLQALTVLLRVDGERSILSPAISARVRLRLADAIARLAANQRPGGYWTPDWFLRSAEPSSNEDYDAVLFDPSLLAQATGHHLEWLQIAPTGLAIEPEARRRAIAWCADVLDRASAEDVEKNVCPYTHCFRMVKRYAAPASDPGGPRP